MLVSVPVGVVTVTRPLVAPPGTVAVRNVSETTLNAADCDVVVTGTPIDLGRLITSKHPIRHVRYELEEVGSPTIADVLGPIVSQAMAAHPESVVAG